MVVLFAGERIQDAWRELEYCLRTGDPVFRKRGLDDPFTDPTRSPDENANFDAAMADITKLTAIAVAAAYDFGPFRTVVDVGGGNGAMLIGILNANRICVGLSSTSRMPRSAHRNRSPRVRYRSGVKPSGGDFFKEVSSGADAYILKHVIHDWNDDRAVTILKSCYRAMSENGKLLIVEGVYLSWSRTSSAVALPHLRGDLG
jgi:SAM-dependent methyltransferase